MARDGFSNLSYEDWEIGYVLLNKVVALFSVKPWAIIIVTSVLSLVGPFYLIGRYSTNPFMSVFLYLNMYLFYLDMNYIRQAIAMSIMCFAFGLLRDKKFWRFLLLTCVAATFHFTVIYMVLVYLFALLKISPRSMLLYCFGLLFYYILSDGVLNILLGKFHTEYAGSIFIENGVYYYYSAFPLILCLAMAALALYLKEVPRSLGVLMHMTFMMGFWQIVMTKHALFERFSYYTMIFVILAVPEAIKAFDEKLGNVMLEKYTAKSSDGTLSRSARRKACSATKRVVVIVSAVVMLLALAYNMVGLIVPEKGVHGVLPYDTQQHYRIPNIDSFFKG